MSALSLSLEKDIVEQFSNGASHNILLAHAKGLFIKYYPCFTLDEYAALTPMNADFSNSSLMIHLRSMHRDGNISFRSLLFALFILL